MMAKLESCPSATEYRTKFGDDPNAPNGYTCVVTVDKGWDPLASPLSGIGKFDASEGKCVYCEGKIESKIIATTSSIDDYIDESVAPCVDLPFVTQKATMATSSILPDYCGCGWLRSGAGWTNYHDPLGYTCDPNNCCGNFKDVPGNGKCESACGAEAACDEVEDGNPCRDGLMCEHLGELCDSTKMKCENCRCEKAECDTSKGDECSATDQSRCGVNEVCDLNTCTCTGCGNGVIEAGEECDPGDSSRGKNPVGCDGISMDGHTPQHCLGGPDNPLDPMPWCKCQDCGDGRVTGREDCDVGSAGHPAVPCTDPSKICVDCQCVSGSPPPPTGCVPAEYGVVDEETINFGEEKTVGYGNIKYWEKCCSYNAAHVEITKPWGGPKKRETLYSWDGVHTHVTYERDTEAYHVVAVDMDNSRGNWIKVQAWCEPIPSGEICDNDVDEPDKNNNASICDPMICGGACAPDCEVSPDDKIDCEDDECPSPGGCGRCQVEHCISNPADVNLPGITCDDWETCKYDWACITDPTIGPHDPTASPPVVRCSTDAECVAAAGPGSKCLLFSTIPAIPDCHCLQPETGNCFDDVDNDYDGCTDADPPRPDSDCGGKETGCGGGDLCCFNGTDDDCDGDTDCRDPDCEHTAPDCNRCQYLTCLAADNWQWGCPTDIDAGAECSTDAECIAKYPDKWWCNLETCKCEVPPPTLASKWRIEDVACKIIVLLQEIVAGIATLIIVYAGIKWMGSGVTDPVARHEAADMIKAVFVGLVIIIVALQFINYMFGNELGTISCPTNVSWHNMIIICGTPYMCHSPADGVCPQDFGVLCDVHDPDCS